MHRLERSYYTESLKFFESAGEAIQRLREQTLRGVITRLRKVSNESNRKNRWLPAATACRRVEPQSFEVDTHADCRRREFS